MLAFRRARQVGLGIQETLQLAAGVATAGRKPALALLSDGLPRDQHPLANTACPGRPAEPPLGAAGMKGQEGGILGAGVDGTPAAAKS